MNPIWGMANPPTQDGDEWGWRYGVPGMILIGRGYFIRHQAIKQADRNAHRTDPFTLITANATPSQVIGSPEMKSALLIHLDTHAYPQRIIAFYRQVGIHNEWTWRQACSKRMAQPKNQSALEESLLHTDDGSNGYPNAGLFASAEKCSLRPTCHTQGMLGTGLTSL
jgi:hypothetical protein